MTAESGFCYVVLYSNGFIKGGKSRDVFKRYKTHKATATALGISVKKAFYTEPHPTYHANEKRLLSALAAASQEHVGEFFRGISEDSAFDALISLGLWISAIEECPFGMPQDAYLALAKSGLGLEARRVLDILLAKLDFENWVHLPQAEIAEILNMKPGNVSRSMRDLEKVGVILRGPKVGRSITYRINPNFGWKGSAKAHNAALNEDLKERMKERGMSVVQTEEPAA